MPEGSDDAWINACRARCLDCDYSSGAKIYAAARAAGRAHSIEDDHEVTVEDHPEVDEL